MVRRTGLFLVLAACWASLCAAAPATSQPSPDGGETATKVGLDERLGARLPLDLVFRDETGKEVRLRELITGPTIVLPVYYGCSNVCNYLQGGLARALPEVKREPGKEYRVISVSIDETETPELAARYQRMYLSALRVNFPPGGWKFLTGDAQNIKRFADAAGYRFQRKGRDFLHPVASFVVAGDGMIVRYLYGTNFLSKDLTLALLEAREGKVGTTIRKVVDYCFSFDPNSKSYEFNLLRVSATVVILCCGGFFLFLVLTGRKGKQHPLGDK
ncbi:cytochrome-c oxidase [Geomonas limicola]|uniref:Cytochrome-c oxidase n=2 Tax=Geomonas limicola TaxID=2740186 RepID=A0A6V8N4Z4_9BACT|nr:cytochrome-c oxidase [Geomonas limicola]